MDQTLRDNKFLSYTRPMLAAPGGDFRAHQDWLYEIKWDGYRAVAEVNDGEVKLYSRNGLSFAKKFEIVYNELLSFPGKMILDGEIVLLDENHQPSFQKLQAYRENQHLPLKFYVFDLLMFNDLDITSLPLIERKKALKRALPESDIVLYCDHIEEQATKFFEKTREMGLEGIIGKQKNSAYYTDTRSDKWLKFKHEKTDEAVIVGYTSPRESRKYFGSLILAQYDAANQLRYVGHAGSGYNDKELKAFYELLHPHTKDETDLVGQFEPNAEPHWVTPLYVCTVKYTERTADGRFRHPTFVGMREDLSPQDLQNSRPKTVAKPTQKPLGQLPEKVRLTSLEKRYFPEQNITKGQVIEYYQSIAEYLLPHLKNRPQSLRRFPNGINAPSFYNKDVDHAPDWIEQCALYSESGDRTIDYLLCNNKESLAYINNLSCIDINPWKSRIETIDQPDFLSIDLDPSKKNTFDDVVECAQATLEILQEIGAPAYCKTSGSRGIHIYVPLGAKYSYEQAKLFAELICSFVQQKLPDLTTMERSLSKRSAHKIYLDYLQNARGQTLASVYSVRPRPHASVSTPLLPKELKKGLRPTDFNLFTMPDRLKEKGDLFKGVLTDKVDMMACLQKLS
ncbi:MAG: DNA ligase D [Saprospiraceae bacterium]|nr:DNA ligase D [Saprospiraceae bacterium]